MSRFRRAFRISSSEGGGPIEGAAGVSITAALRSMQFVSDGKGRWLVVSSQ